MRRLPALCTAALAAVLLFPGGASAASRHASGPVAQTDKGAVRGVRDQGVDSFLGIRYAAPPTGNLRWRPPQPAAPWSGGDSRVISDAAFAAEHQCGYWDSVA